MKRARQSAAAHPVPAAPPVLVLLFTTFPVATETFLQREVEALAAEGVALELWSLWGGGRHFGDLPVHRPPLGAWFTLLGWLPYWTLRRPRVVGGFLRLLLRRRPPNRINLGETLAGLGLALCYAHRWSGRRDCVVHAVWASMPATFAWALQRLTGLPFSFAAHAYDLFEDGGDWLLDLKCTTAAGIRTSTEAGRKRLIEAGARPERVHLVRRGLRDIPEPLFDRSRAPREPLRILSVGRLVEKMGYPLQLQVYLRLRQLGVDFVAEIVGEGPERSPLERQIAAHGLASQVRLCGAQPFTAVEERMRGAHLALFTGVVASNGDRAGFPNFIGEAMAAGLPVVATPVGAVEEVLRHRDNAWLASDAAELAAGIEAVRDDPAAAARRARAARQWVERHFDGRENARQLRAVLGV